MVCPWPFMASLDSTVAIPAKQTEVGKSFAQALSDSCDFQLSKPPPKIELGKFVRVKITQDEYEYGLVDCSSNIHGRLILHKGDPPLTTQALKTNYVRWGLTFTTGTLPLLARASLSFTLHQWRICVESGLWGWLT